MKHSLTGSSGIHHTSGEPVAAFEHWQRLPEGMERMLLVDFVLQQYWLPQAPPISLTALYCLCGDQLHVAVTDQPLFADGSGPLAQYLHWTSQHGLCRWQPGQTLELLPTAIPKPWGRELWFTGVEQRGVCCFGRAGRRTPIPWLQAVAPAGAVGEAGGALVLLKILDPLAEPVRGDLYFELHETKREVYVVTHVDEAAWPGGIGYIRLGFDPQRIADFPGEEDFRQAYLEAVQAYEYVRRELDDMLQQGGTPDPGQLAREASLRQAMNRFTHLRPLRVGDVLPVPLRVPHALQHGVRTVEFQTPVYERKILSFAQKVLTQEHWDTAEAVPDMLLQAPPTPDFDFVEQGAGLRVERIVDFPDFEVCRVTLKDGASWMLSPRSCYSLAMVIAGELDMGETGACGAEQALLLPAGWSGPLKSSEAARPLVLLWAAPRG